MPTNVEARERFPPFNIQYFARRLPASNSRAVWRLLRRSHAGGPSPSEGASSASPNKPPSDNARGGSFLKDFSYLRFLLLLCVLGLLVVTLREYYTTDLILQPLTVSVGLERAGVSATALTHRLAEQMEDLTVATDTIQRSHISPASQETSLDIEIPETKLSLKTVTEFIRHLLPLRTVPTVTGDAMLIDGKCSLTLRVAIGTVPTPADTWTSTRDLKEIDALVSDGAMFTLERAAPITAAVYHYNYDDDSFVGMRRALAIVEGQSHSFSRERAKSAYVFWGAILADQRLFLGAFAKYAQATQQSGMDETILLGQAAAYDALGNVTERILHARRALDFRRTPPTLVAVGDTLRGISDAKAIRYYRAAIEKDRSYWPAYIALSRVGQDNDDWSAATSFAKLAIAAAPTRREQAPGWTQLGNIAGQRRQYDTALNYYRRAVQLNGGDADSYEGMALAQYELGAPKAAADLIEEATCKTTNYPAYILKDWGDLLRLHNQDVEAEKLYRRAIDADHQQTFEFARGALGTLYYELGRPDEAQEQFRIAVSMSQYPAKLHTNWGDALTGIGNRCEAVNHYKEALRLDPQQCDARLAVARLMYQDALDQNRSVYAEVLYKDAFASCFYSAQVLFHQAETVESFRDLEQPLYERLLQWDPGNWRARIRFAANMSHKEANRAIQAGIGHTDYPASLLAAWGTELAWQKRPSEAGPWLSRAQSIDDGNAKSKNVQLALMVDQGLVTLDDLRHRLPAVLGGTDDTILGDALMRKSWFLEAEAVLRNAARLYPDDAYINQRLAAALKELGKIDEERTFLTRAARSYLRKASRSKEAASVYEALLSGRHREHLAAGFAEVYERELDRIPKTIAK